MTRISVALVALLSLATSSQAQPVFPQSAKPSAKPEAALRVSPEPGKPLTTASFVQLHDRNGDLRLNADECPVAFRPSFGRLDLNHDGYLDETELGLGLKGWTDPARKRGNVVARAVTVVADDFVVEVYHNGEKVPDARRTLNKEVYGASTETIDVEIREGDWLVFNVVNNRFRWGGASYFAAAGLKPGSGFVSETKSGRWSYCDEPDQVLPFIAMPSYLAQQAVKPIANKWGDGDVEMTRVTDGWTGEAIWGGSRNTWIKYVAPSSGHPIGVTY